MWPTDFIHPLYRLKFSSGMLDFFGKLLHCTALSPVQCNNFPEKIDIVYSLQAFAPMTYFLLSEFLKKKQSMEHVQRPPRHKLARTDLRSPRPGFARIRRSQHMGAAVCGQTLYIAVARFVWSKKCLGEDAQEFKMLIRRSASRQRSIPVPFQNGAHEIIVFYLHFFIFTMTKLVFAWAGRAGIFFHFMLVTSTWTHRQLWLVTFFVPTTPLSPWHDW